MTLTVRQMGGVLLVLVLGLWSCTEKTSPDVSAPDHDRDREQGADEDLSALVALPYLSWSEEEIDPEQLGITHWDQVRAWDGINLYTNDVNEAYLMDMEGRRLHTWTLPEKYVHCEHFELLAGGRAAVVCVGQGVVVVDRQSSVIWELKKPVHHDLALRSDGSFLVPVMGRWRDYRNRKVNFDGLLHVSAAGEVLSRWRTWSHLETFQALHEPSSLDEPFKGLRPQKSFDYYHLNSVEVLPTTPLGRRDMRFRAGNLLLCLRNTHLILVLDPEAQEVTWSWGPGELSFPHMPTMLDDGNILIFDNGVDRESSRVLEIEPVRREIVWQYEGDPPASFFSKRRGSSQRLPNGNTLICESDRGRVFEVGPEGDMVWEFWNPDIEQGRRKRIYRFMRRSREEVRELFRTRISESQER